MNHSNNNKLETDYDYDIKQKINLIHINIKPFSDDGIFSGLHPDGDADLCGPD